LQPFLVGFLRIASLYFILFYIFLFFWEKNEFWGITQNWVMTPGIERLMILMRFISISNYLSENEKESIDLLF